ncbi:MAG: inositol monophosphatase family protein [Propioniciclava sp.]
MGTTTADVADLIVAVTERIVLPRFRSLAADEVIEKRPGDVVTVADREAEIALTAALRQRSPGALIVGEEATFAEPSVLADLPAADHAWVIDPVDGTRNFANGTADFGVIVAEVRSGITERGWIWQPIHQRMFTVERGRGAACNGEPMVPAPAREQPWHAAVPRRLRGGGDRAFTFSRTLGSCAIDYPRVALGEVDGLGYTTQHPWDHLAGSLLVTELGGRCVIPGRVQPWRVGERGPVLLVGADPGIAAALERAALAVLPSPKG